MKEPKFERQQTDLKNLVGLIILLFVGYWFTTSQLVADLSSPPKSVELQHLMPKNMMSNPGLENGKTGWSVSANASELTITTTSGEVVSGQRAIKWDPSAAAILSLPSWTVKVNASGNGVASFWYRTADSDYDLRIYDGTNVVATMDLPATADSGADFKFVALNFPAIENLTYTAQVVAPGDESVFGADDAYIGYADGVNITQVRPPLTYSANISSADAVTRESPEDWINGNCTDADTGEATCTFNTGFFTATPNCTASCFSTATNTCIATIITSSLSSTGVTISTETDTGSSADREINLSCHKTGADATATLQAYNPASQAQSWSGYHDNTCSWARTNTAYGDPTADASCALVERTNNNFGTVTTYTVTNAMPGIVFTPRVAGRYWVCASAKMSRGTGGAIANVRLWDGTTTVAESQEQHSASSGQSANVVTCGIYYASSVASKTLSLQTKATSGSVTIVADSTNASAVEWSIFPIDQQLPAPSILNDVATPSSAGVKICSGFVTNSGTAVVTRSDGNCLSFSADNGAGDSTFTFAANTFSGTPNCTCSLYDANSGYACSVDPTTAISSTTVRFQTFGGTGAADRDFFFICIGQR